MKFRRLSVVLGSLGLLLSQLSFASSMVGQWNFDDKTGRNSATETPLRLNIFDEENDLVRDSNNRHYYVLQTSEFSQVFKTDINELQIKASFGGSFWIKNSVLLNGQKGQMLRLRTKSDFILQVEKTDVGITASLFKNELGNLTKYAETQFAISDDAVFNADWQHIAFSINPTINCYNLALYVANEARYADFLSTDACNDYRTTEAAAQQVLQMHIGGSSSPSSDSPLLSDNKWLGKFDDLRLYNVSLTDYEVTCLSQYGSICVLGEQRGKQGTSGLVQTQNNYNDLKAAALGETQEWTDIIEPGQQIDGQAGKSVTELRRGKKDDGLDNVYITIEIEGIDEDFEQRVTPHPADSTEKYTNNIISSITTDTNKENGELTITTTDTTKHVIKNLNGVQLNSTYTISNGSGTDYTEVTTEENGQTLIKMKESDGNLITTDEYLARAQGPNGEGILGEEAIVENAFTVLNLGPIGDTARTSAVNIETIGDTPEAGKDQKGKNDVYGAKGAELYPIKTQVGTAPVGKGYDYFIPIIVDGITVVLPPAPEENDMLMYFSNGEIANIGKINGTNSPVDGKRFSDVYSISNVTIEKKDGETYQSDASGSCELIDDGVVPLGNHTSNGTQVDVKLNKTAEKSWQVLIDPAQYPVTIESASCVCPSSDNGNISINPIFTPDGCLAPASGQAGSSNLGLTCEELGCESYGQLCRVTQNTNYFDYSLASGTLFCAK